MKFILPIICAVVGFAASSADVHEVIMDQPEWLMIVEGALAYIVVGVLSGAELAARSAADHQRSYFKGDPDGICGLFGGIFWPVAWSIVMPIVKMCQLGKMIAEKRADTFEKKRRAKRS